MDDAFAVGPQTFDGYDRRGGKLVHDLLRPGFDGGLIRRGGEHRSAYFRPTGYVDAADSNSDCFTRGDDWIDVLRLTDHDGYGAQSPLQGARKDGATDGSVVFPLWDKRSRRGTCDDEDR